MDRLALFLGVLVCVVVTVECCDIWKDRTPECIKKLPWGNGPGRSSGFSYKTCCKGKKEKKEKCLNTRYTGTSMRKCFGASGYDCEGVPELAKGGRLLEEVGKFLDDRKMERLGQTILVKKLPNGKLKVPTTVGSIFHDTCCARYPDGVFCNSYNRPFGSILQPKTNGCHCSAEWRKAVFNLISGRWWYTTFEKDHVSDHTPTGKMLPKTIFPKGLFRYDKNHKHGSNYGYKEVKAVSKLRAPSGTKLDCPGIDPRCRTGFMVFNKETDDSAEDGKNLLKAKQKVKDRKRTPRAIRAVRLGKEDVSLSLRDRKRKSAGFIAGDSVFCESGRFRSLHFRLKAVAHSRRYGICL